MGRAVVRRMRREASRETNEREPAMDHRRPRRADGGSAVSASDTVSASLSIGGPCMHLSGIRCDNCSGSTLTPYVQCTCGQPWWGITPPPPCPAHPLPFDRFIWPTTAGAGSVTITATPSPDRKGWACPKCERVFAPHVDECRKCNP